MNGLPAQAHGDIAADSLGGLSMQEAGVASLPAIMLNHELVEIRPPASVLAAGDAAAFAWEEFFAGQIRNTHTRVAYLRAVRRFLHWCEGRGLPLPDIRPGHVGRYLDEHPGSPPSKKLVLSAVRGFLDVLVNRHVVILNAAHSVRTERFSALEGKTPEITVEQVRTLIQSVELERPIDYRDRGILAVLIYTAARAGAVGRLRLSDLVDEGNQYALRFQEKGGKYRSIPVRHDLQDVLQQYRELLPKDSSKESPLFRTATGRKGTLTAQPVTGVDICRMVKRRLRSAGLPTIISPHSFRSCTATDLLLQGIALESVQMLLGHADARVTRLYDRRQKQVTRNIVERISV